MPKYPEPIPKHFSDMLYKATIDTVLRSTSPEGLRDRIVHTAQGMAALRSDGTWSVKYHDVENRGTTVISGSPAGLALRRSGLTDSRMVFEAGRKAEVFYRTAAGLMDMAVDTREYACEVTADGGRVSLDYDLYIAGQRVGRNELEMRWRRRS